MNTARPLTPEMVAAHPDDTPEMARLRKAAKVLRYRHLMKPAPPPLMAVPIPDAEKRTIAISTRWGRKTVSVPHLTYVIQSGDFVKIGATADIERRLRELKIASPHDVTVIALLAGGRTAEGVLHRRFKAHRHRHEWFRIEGALAEWIEKGCPDDA